MHMASGHPAKMTATEASRQDKTEGLSPADLKCLLKGVLQADGCVTTLEGIRDISGEGKKREVRASTGHSTCRVAWGSRQRRPRAGSKADGTLRCPAGRKSRNLK